MLHSPNLNSNAKKIFILYKILYNIWKQKFSIGLKTSMQHTEFLSEQYKMYTIHTCMWNCVIVAKWQFIKKSTTNHRLEWNTFTCRHSSICCTYVISMIHSNYCQMHLYVNYIFLWFLTHAEFIKLYFHTESYNSMIHSNYCQMYANYAFLWIFTRTQFLSTFKQNENEVDSIHHHPFPPIFFLGLCFRGLRSGVCVFKVCVFETPPQGWEKPRFTHKNATKLQKELQKITFYIFNFVYKCMKNKNLKW